MCLIYLMGKSLETYMFVHWFLLISLWLIGWVKYNKPIFLFTVFLLFYVWFISCGDHIKHIRFCTGFYSSVFDIFDEYIIRNIYVCSLVVTCLWCMYLMGGSIETYLFVHWSLLFCVWFISWVDHYKPICLIIDFFLFCLFLVGE